MAKKLNMSKKLLLIIPPVVRLVDGVYEAEVDFSHNLRLYLCNFDHVTFCCPVSPTSENSGILRSVAFEQIPGNGRLTFIELPYTYREDRHLRHFFSTRKLLRSEIKKADYLIVSPHAKYDWATLAALEAIKLRRKYDAESDWDHASVQRLQLAKLKPGIKKLRKALWMHTFLKAAQKCFKHSSLALLQGQDVFDAYKNVAPNPQKVLNVQVGPEDHIPQYELAQKLERIRAGKPLIISYAGRMIEMKGPIDWLRAIQIAVQAGATLQATWFGSGSMMPQMRQELSRLGISDTVSFPGIVDRDAIMAALRQTDIFLFCHKTGELPRCLGEALAAGCLILGYDTAYPRDLVSLCGGGKFTEIGNWRELGNMLASLDRDRPKLAELVSGAAASGRLLDRDRAMQDRIDLIKKYLSA